MGKTISAGIPAGFTDGDPVLNELLAEPGMARAVDNVNRGVAEMDRVYAQGLAEIRKFAAQTQSDLAEKMGVQQAAVSRIEGRDDLLLSTLAQYAAAAGATGGRIVFQINGVQIELPLDRYLAAAQ
jgi:DNA-binding XRE family transcriptional regulator